MPGLRDPHVTPAVFLTPDIPPVGGVLKQRAEDFIVEEIPAYDPVGEGEHIYLYIEKHDLPALQMVSAIARHFGVRTSDVGYAGLKDKTAVTRQLVSVHVPGKKIADFPSLRHDRIRVLWAEHHTNKLRRGHLKGNRFAIKIRNTPITGVFAAKKVLDRLAAVGAPNRAGEQRFGFLANNHLIGRALLLNDAPAALAEMLGPESLAGHEAELADPHQAEARALFAEGRFADAAARLPRSAETERAVLLALARGSTPERALAAIGPVPLSFYITAWQSAVFNAVLDRRLEAGTLAALGEGDVAIKHENGACFPVTAETLAQPDLAARLVALEISPTGPMWSEGMLHAAGAVADAELAAMTATGVTADHLAAFMKRLGDRTSIKGDRRPLRVPVQYPDVEAGGDEHGPFIRCSFELPPGAFATSVMQEVMKTPR